VQKHTVQSKGLTDHPQTCALQAKFLMGAYRQHAEPGGKLRTVLELGCGPANHAIQLAKRGVQAWALDANPHMLQYAAQKAAAAGVSGVSGLTTVQGDMTDYTIKVGAVTANRGLRAAVRSRSSAWSVQVVAAGSCRWQLPVGVQTAVDG
jgi:SAM-dependent methyltransferase